MSELSHVDSQGRAAMVDTSGKESQYRLARAAGTIVMSPATRDLIRQNQVRKGDVLTVAQIAGIQGAKRTAELIPLCHPLVLDKVDVQLQLSEEGVRAVSEVSCIGRTGVEMEALVAVGVALLAVYDMCKAVDGTMRIREISLVEKVKSDVPAD
jgi:cyclic pyranopterin monophosphate synthase